jgi:hypothetical protein
VGAPNGRPPFFCAQHRSEVSAGRFVKRPDTATLPAPSRAVSGRRGGLSAGAVAGGRGGPAAGCDQNLRHPAKRSGRRGIRMNRPRRTPLTTPMAKVGWLTTSSTLKVRRAAWRSAASGRRRDPGTEASPERRSGSSVPDQKRATIRSLNPVDDRDEGRGRQARGPPRHRGATGCCAPDPKPATQKGARPEGLTPFRDSGGSD